MKGATGRGGQPSCNSLGERNKDMEWGHGKDKVRWGCGQQLLTMEGGPTI